MRIIPHQQFDRLQVKAIEGGATGPHYALSWALHGRCSNPYEMRYQRSRTITEGTLDLIVPCRSCQHCLKRRARFWSARAGQEYAMNPRVWFGTFTFHPRYRGVLRAALTGLTVPQERQLALVQASGMYVSRYLKKIRKTNKVRYLFAPELHRDGMVHWHALIHSQASWRSLAKPWTVYGFTKMNLVTHPVKNIRYVTKYLAKAKFGRVRASFRYGVPPVGIPPEEAGEKHLYNSALMDVVHSGNALWFKELFELLARLDYLVDDEGIP